MIALKIRFLLLEVFAFKRPVSVPWYYQDKDQHLLRPSPWPVISTKSSVRLIFPKINGDFDTFWVGLFEGGLIRGRTYSRGLIKLHTTCCI